MYNTKIKAANERDEWGDGKKIFELIEYETVNVLPMYKTDLRVQWKIYWKPAAIERGEQAFDCTCRVQTQHDLTWFESENG